MKATKIFTMILLSLLVFSGCDRQEEVGKDQSFVYYLNLDGTGLEKRAYEYTEKSTLKRAQEALEAMDRPEEGEKVRSLLSEGVKVKKVTFSKGVAGVHFNGAFTGLTKLSETLLLGGMTYTLTQFPEIEGVQVYIDDSELADADGQARGVLHKEDFIENIGASIHTTETAKIALYYGNQTGDKLVKRMKSVRYNSNSSIEKLVVEKLIKGTKTKEETSPLASDVIVLGVTVKDGICYLNLSESFMSTQGKTSPEVTIYSLVNSIIDTSESVQKVQISINGESDVKYKENISLSKPFSKNRDIIEE
ncbi:GerMN domain-containing protein [Ohessyouella blattaphilus]|uniref:GerMN domain-containing protein n=1 Tax=Ohessyouella blattaphilus TaxID=2949333 RepID=A0ABT1EHN9_9FIRM|nr:GerMN domain-containing protein [Ohessyouella blattaphilus]MCP1110216.1 GerMN domain-containing protein [Ohessyouella blattaphilus]MCR8563610.1 GerMN domain-containing protein [Ohessyouella blattaphilus]